MFVDTSGWASACDRSQSYHGQADSLVRRARRNGIKLVTTNYVLNELVSLLTSPLRIPKHLQVLFLTDLRQAPWLEIVHIDQVEDAAAWQLWESRPDKSWSLVDCASFSMMRGRNLADALTTDHHFEQAGFVRLLK
jgi:uncharacterized protein